MKVNYPQLGDPSTPKTKHPEGAVITHPSGAQYQRIGGNWVYIGQVTT